MKKKHRAIKDSLLALVSADLYMLQRAGLTEEQAGQQVQAKFDLGMKLLEEKRSAESKSTPVCSCGKDETHARSWN